MGRQLLEACGGNLELAVDMHMDGAVSSQPSTSGAQAFNNNRYAYVVGRPWVWTTLTKS